METPGKRLPNDQWPKNPGEYAKVEMENGETFWMACCPKAGIRAGCLNQHKIDIHEDGTISVEGKITYNKNWPDMPQWSGFLTKGIWIEV